MKDGRKMALRSIKNCGFTYEVTELLARKIKKMPQYANCDIESMGTFGMKAESSISVKDNGKLIGFLTIRYGYNGAFEYVDYNRKIGFNYATKILPTKLDDAIKLVLSKGREIPRPKPIKDNNRQAEYTLSDLFDISLEECRC